MADTNSNTVPAGSSNEKGPGDALRAAKSRVGRNVLANWTGLGMNILIGFLMAPFMVHRLGDVSYGIWALVLQLTGYMGVFDVGVRSALVRFSARFHTQGDQTSMNQLLTLAIAFYSVLAVIGLAAAGLVGKYVLPHLHIPEAQLSSALIALYMAAATMACAFTLGMFQAVLAGLSRWDIVNGIGITTLLVRTGLVVVLLLSGYGLVAIAITHFLTALGGYAAAALMANRLLGGVRFCLSSQSRALFKPMLVHSVFSFLISVGNKINYELDTIVIAAFLPVQTVTAYVIGFKLPRYLLDFVNVSAQIVSPIASGTAAEGRTAELGELLIRGTKYTLIVIYLVNAALLLAGRELMLHWMGSAYVHSSGTVLMILAAGLFFSATQSMGSHMLYGLGKHSLNVWCTSLEAVLNIGLSVALVQTYGIFGVAAGTAIASTLVRGWFFPRGFLKVLHVNPWDYLRRAILPVLPPTVAFFLGFQGIGLIVSTRGIVGLALACAAGVACYASCAWWWALDRHERETISGALLRKLPGQAVVDVPVDEGSASIRSGE